MNLRQRKDEQSLAFGGQALIEGVMMRSQKHVVMSIRQPDNNILTHTQEIKSLRDRHRFLGLPIIRGVIALLEALYHGIKSIYFSANVALAEEEEKFTWREFVIAVLLALVLNSLFIFLPFLLTSLLNLRGTIFNIVEAFLRLSIFLVYLMIVASWGEFKKILQYHGAEHKAINAYEAGRELEIINVKEFSRLNPRCGTSFIFIAVFISIFFFSIMPNRGFYIRLAYRVLLIPIIGGVSYEILKFSDKHRDSFIMKILTLPGLAFQRLTTREPNDSMLEVAVEALKEVISLNES